MRIKVKCHKRARFPLWILVTLFIIFLVTFCISEFLLIKWHLDNKEIIKISEELEKELIVEKKEIPIEDIILVNPPQNQDQTQESDYWYYVNKPFTQVSFSSLLEKNSDTVGYIHVENTNINYPIVYSSNNEYYLTHAFNGKKNNAGWIFLDYRNNFDDLSDNTIVYGHGRNNTTMFGSLKNTLTSSWQSDKDNYVVTISTPKENMLFQIFSIYTIEAESYYIETEFSSSDEKNEWIKIMKERNISPINTYVDENDKILTLSTCKNNYGERIVVHAKLIKKVANVS